ncbi:hypothetical protein ACWC4C_27915 [Streptomyces olivaceoviridis]
MRPDLVLAAERRSADLTQARIRQFFSGGGSGLRRIGAYLLLERDVLRGCGVGRLVGDPEIVAEDALRAPDSPSSPSTVRSRAPWTRWASPRTPTPPAPVPAERVTAA